jgi:hypothetical protein
MGYRVAPDSGQDFSDLKIRSCPVADVNRIAPIVQNYNRHKNELIKISDVYSTASIALIDLFEVIDYNVKEAQNRASERAMKEASK